ncbi:hypothetical protein CJ469_06046 [Nocardia farcinica]|uniref:DUF5994 family protein n=1 Tax=Nocardia farcinica TaxID=37329 RepID=UPI000C01CC04|nr:DUF5994 family protein [Nocardia farcinica]PFW98645.1 hypothetical protein CJ469_06046 [Nocardia farcinica]
MTRQHEPILLDRSSRFALRSGPPPSSRRSPTPRAPRPGAVDGAWWPRTSDLVAELAGLEALLGRRAGSLDRIMYNMDAWQPAPRRTMLGGRSVRLDGSRHLPAHTLCVLGSHRTRLVLLVIPANTQTAAAHALLWAASRPGNAFTADELVAADTRHSLDRTQNEAALRRWDDEGGHPAAMDPADRRASVARSPALTGGLI